MPDITNTPSPITDVGNKAAAAIRYLASNLSGALALLAVLGTISPDTSHQIITLFQQLAQNVQDLFGTIGKLWVVIFPIISVYLAKIGVQSSGFANMLGKITGAAKSGNTDAQKALVIAAAQPEIGTQAIVNPKFAPDPATPPNVVVAPEVIQGPLPINGGRR